MTLRSRVERIESGIDIAALTPAQVVRLDVTMLTKAQLQASNISHLTEDQLCMLNVRDLSDAQIDAIHEASPPEVRAWLESLTDDELRAIINGEMPIPGALLCAEA
ncbi:MAG: hypothetical protein V7641_5013 [Blastocatellia bacterium]